MLLLVGTKSSLLRSENPHHPVHLDSTACRIITWYLAKSVSPYGMAAVHGKLQDTAEG